MKLLKLTKYKDEQPCYINPINVQYLSEYSLTEDDGGESLWTEIFMIGGKVSVLEPAETIRFMMRDVDKS